MPRDSTSSRIIARVTQSRNPPEEANENVFENSLGSAQFPPPRTPLNTIPDPSQFHRETQDSDVDSKEKLEKDRGGRLSGRKIESLDRTGTSATPRFSTRQGKPHSEPNSVQSTPARNGSRVSLARATHFTKGKDLSSTYRLSNRNYINISDFREEAQHFELEEDPAFWADHNAQVLIRIRPLSNMERDSQRHGRCLRQESSESLVWLGHPETRFTFDHIACETISQEKLFRVVGVPMVENCMSGYNSCMFAYGQTGSGKTYTMMGEINQQAGKLSDDCGITPRTFEYLFSRIRMEEESRRNEKLRFSCKCSFLEIYNEQITDLLEDSLGGNSKTTIIANVSPSMCSALETLSTLKFAQRAKLIQNNAKVNEDASGDVSTLQRQIQRLKDQLSFLIKHHNLSTPMHSSGQHFEESTLASYPQMYNSSEGKSASDDQNLSSVAYKKKKCMEATLIGAIRREKMAEMAVKKLEAEMERVNQFAFQRLEEFQKNKMIFKVREEKIKNLEFLLDGSLLADDYLIEENRALKEEILLLQARIEKNPELTRFALEDLRLLERLQLFQNFYEQGERETLLAEISELREQLLDMLETKLKFSSRYENQDDDILEELVACRNMNSKLMREVEELKGELKNYQTCTQAAFNTVTNSLCKDAKEIRHADRYSLVEIASTEGDSVDEMASYDQADDTDLKNKDSQEMSTALVTQTSNTQKELIDARLLIEAMESEQVHLIEELQHLQERNRQYLEMLNKKDKVERESEIRVGNELQELQNLEKQNKSLMMGGIEDTGSRTLQAKFEKLTIDLEQARLLNCQYQEYQESQLSHQHQVELICEQVEMETTRTILHLQEEIGALQLDLNEKLCCISQDNVRLRNALEAKEEEIRMLCGEWERATFELTSFLIEGSKSLEDASGQIERIFCSFPQVNVCLREHVKRAARACIDKEEAILQLEKSLEDAQKMVMEMELKLYSLKEATIALNEYPQSDNDQSIEEATNLGMLLNEKNHMIMMLESQLKCKEDHTIEAEKCAKAAFLVVKWLSDCYKQSPNNDIGRGINISKLVPATEKGNQEILEIQTHENALTVEDAEAQVDLERLILESENAIKAFYKGVEMHIASLQTTMLEASSTYTKWVQDFVNEIQEMRSIIMELKQDNPGFQSSAVKFKASKSLAFQESEKLSNILHPIRYELVKMNERLKIIEDSINKNISPPVYLLTEETLAEEDSWSADNQSSGYFSPGSELSIESLVLGNQMDGFSYSCCSKSSGRINEQSLDLKIQSGTSVDAESENSVMLLRNSHPNEAMTLCLRKELDVAFHEFNKLYAHLTAIFDGNDIVDISYPGEMKIAVQAFGLRMKIAEASCQNIRKVVTDDRVNHDSTFLCKFDEARATMREADYMLNALLKENENAKQLNDTWKQASEKLTAERSWLLKENEQLKALMCSKEEENQLLLDQICQGLAELTNAICSFEGCFLQMQREVEDRYKDLHLNLLFMGKEMLEFFCNSRSSLEDIFSEIMQKEFALSMVYQCVVGEVIHKIPSFNMQHEIYPFGQQKYRMLMNTMQKVFSSDQDNIVTASQRVAEGEETITDSEEEGLGLSHDNLIHENMSLKKELDRKEVLLKGLLFDLSLLQEAASDKKDTKDETEKLILALSEVRQELEMKTSQFDALLVQYRKVKGDLEDTENALSMSNFDLLHAKERRDTLADQNVELRMLLKDLYLERSEAEEELEEQKEAVRGLEKEVIHLTTSVERNIRSSVEGLEEELKKIIDERDQLRAEICTLNDKLDMAYALADENEAIAVESQQESEASKLYAEQKEEEVKILEHSVEELECTINVLEKKVYEMDEEVERHRLIRESLELELQALRQRLLTVENFTDIVDSENTNSVKEDPITRQLQSKLLELHEAHNQIRHLERDIAEKDEEVKQFKEYISELILHSEAQASQFQDKYKTLEAMVHEVKTNLPNSASAAATLDKTDKSSLRTRGSSSPFRCISSLVQQLNLEKDQSVASLRIEELEAVLASRQKEVCMLNARLAAAESMTHDVIRDLLGVKIDMTNYANLIDQHQVQKLVDAANQQTEELHIKEQEILNLGRQINDLMEEKESCISEINKKVADLIAAQVNVEQLQGRDQLLSAQNEMLKMDKSNLLRRVAELDEMVKTLLRTRSSEEQIQEASETKENDCLLKMGDAALSEKLARSEKLLFRVHDELAQYRKSSSNHSHVKSNECGAETKHRRRKC